MALWIGFLSQPSCPPRECAVPDNEMLALAHQPEVRLSVAGLSVVRHQGEGPLRHQRRQKGGGITRAVGEHEKMRDRNPRQ